YPITPSIGPSKICIIFFKHQKQLTSIQAIKARVTKFAINIMIITKMATILKIFIHNFFFPFPLASFLRSKLKLMTYYELVHTKQKFRFTVGPMGHISKLALFEV